MRLRLPAGRLPPSTFSFRNGRRGLPTSRLRATSCPAHRDPAAVARALGQRFEDVEATNSVDEGRVLDLFVADPAIDPAEEVEQRFRVPLRLAHGQMRV